MSALKSIPLDPQALVDSRPVGRMQWMIFALCAACLVLDGFDVQAIGYVAPSIAAEWGVQPAALGLVFSAGLLGMVIGSSAFSWAADRFGRRPMLIAATALSGVGMLLTSRVSGVEELLAMRLLTGIAVGSLMPNALALTSEYAPARVRTAVVMLMANGFTFGAALGGWVSSAVIPAWGWRAVFIVGGAGPLLIALVMLALLPESLRLLSARGDASGRAGRLLRKLDPSLDDKVDYVLATPEQAVRKPSPRELFRDGRGPTTILLWVVAFMGLLDLYFLSNWLPTVIRGAGFPLQTAVLASTLLQVGGIVGTVVMAGLVARLRLRVILTVSFAVAACTIFLIGHAIPMLPALLAMVAISGFCVVGGQPGLNAFSADFYPTYIRSTGVGWMLGVGRFGSVVGPLLGGVILQMKLGNGALFLFAAVPAAIAALGLVAIGRLRAVT